MTIKTPSKSLLAAAALLAASQFPVAAHAVDYKARYEADKKLCAEESSSGARMQCLRDAKAEYDKALGTAAPVSSGTATRSAAVCKDCGKVVDVHVEEKKGEGGPVGLIAGGVAGAVLGHQVGGGRGKDLATLAGAAGGAYAGHKVEEKVRSTKVWSVKVRLDSGETRSFAFDHDPGFASGDPVKLSGSSIVRR